MSTIAELAVPTAEFALRGTLEAVPDLDVEVERVVAADPGCVMPYVWFSGTSSALAAVDDALAADSTVEDATRLVARDGDVLYQVDWVDDVAVTVHVLTDAHATVLDAAVENTQWQFRVLFPDREALSRTYEFATEQGLPVKILRIHRLEERRHGRYGLTDAQYESLVAALEAGYYEIPRERDMDELSDELDISHQALSERLRRAHRTLVEELVDIGEL
ncbi:helix-turn-helix domain-containing protein [Haloarchaeobius amylolyticus]|uniref:Helix-turn-helix domain-containing protein n=1 Tax=Haloarchaeobius amylolyticus TaxID=1198296 RepID=A0ABD6BBR5_9EURY